LSSSAGLVMVGFLKELASSSDLSLKVNQLVTLWVYVLPGDARLRLEKNSRTTG
jgi:hypothetical protein